MKMEQSVPKRRHINFKRRGITQKKSYKNQNLFMIALSLYRPIVVTLGYAEELMIFPQASNNQTRQAMDVLNNTQVFSRNNCYRENKSDIYSECVFLFLSYLSGMKISSFLLCIILSSVSCPALPYFPTLSTMLLNLNVCFDFSTRFI